MILMWLGSYVLMLFGLTESQKHLAQFFSETEKQILNKDLQGSTVSLFFRSLGISLMKAMPFKSLQTGLTICNENGGNPKGGILLMCLSTLGAWWVLFLGFLFLGFSGLFVLGFCAIGLIAPLRTPMVQLILKWLFAVGIFLIGGELMLRNSSVAQTLLGQSDLAFFLADGRFLPVLILLFVAVVLSFIIQIEFWSLPVVLGLLVTNTLSFNGALGLVVGERIGQMILFWWQNRDLKQRSILMVKQFTLVSLLGLVLGFLIVGEARSAFYFGLSSDMSSLQNKTFQFVLLFAVVLFFQWLLQMVWGHFANQNASKT